MFWLFLSPPEILFTSSFMVKRSRGNAVDVKRIGGSATGVCYPRIPVPLTFVVEAFISGSAFHF